MSIEQWSAVDQYVTDLVVQPDAVLAAALENNRANELPVIDVSPAQGKLLMLLAQAQGARRILEIGTLGGYSSIWLGRALPEDGRLITIEADPKHARVATQNIEHAGLLPRIEIRVGLALDVLPKLETEGQPPFDLIFIDADKASMPHYFEWALKLSRKGTLMVLDNVIRDGAVLSADSDDPNIQGVRRLNEILSTNPLVAATVIQTVGSKGYDGFALVVVSG